MTENERLTLKSVNGDVWLLDSEEKPYLLSVDGDDYNKALNRLAEYETIGTIEEFKALKEKNVGKMMDGYYCPICRHYFEDTDAYNYCPVCGQKMKSILE